MDEQARFMDEDCCCQHFANEHDDGFGCTVDGCPCVAGWEFR